MIGTILTIESTPELVAMRLEGLVGKQGTIKDIVLSKQQDKHIVGYWVELEEPYEDEIEWFIPVHVRRKYKSHRKK